MKSKVFFFTQFPPPVHGFSNVNQSVYEKLVENGSFEIVKFSFTKKIDNKLIFYFDRSLRSLLSVFVILKNYRSARNSTLYMPVSGGLGMIFEILPWFLAGFIFKRRIMHHHSFQYCYRQSGLMSIMQRFQKNNIHNIFLCNCHAKKFGELYQIVNNNVDIISNEFSLNKEYFDTFSKVDESQKKEFIIGHLSNLSIEKGFSTFCELVKKMDGNKKFKFELVGPATNPDILSIINDIRQKFPETFVYKGPLYGNEKIEWYRSLDFFIFPSTYNNETYPLVVSEAILSGAIPFTTGVGCLPEFNHQQLIFPIEIFVNKVSEILISVSEDNVYYNYLKDNLQTVKSSAIAKGQKDIKRLFNLFRLSA